jgi:hypothetical protein
MGRRKLLHSVHEHEMFSAAVVIILLCFFLQGCGASRSMLLDQASESSIQASRSTIIDVGFEMDVVGPSFEIDVVDQAPKPTLLTKAAKKVERGLLVSSHTAFFFVCAFETVISTFWTKLCSIERALPFSLVLFVQRYFWQSILLDMFRQRGKYTIHRTKSSVPIARSISPLDECQIDARMLCAVLPMWCGVLRGRATLGREDM